MRRWHQEIAITKRNWRNHRRIHVESNLRNPYDFRSDRIGKDPYEVDCECDKQIGRFRKKDAYDCGKSRCYVCHNEKLPKRSKHEQELMSEIGFKEQLKELE